MVFTRAQINGTEPLVKISKKKPTKKSLVPVEEILSEDSFHLNLEDSTVNEVDDEVVVPTEPVVCEYVADIIFEVVGADNSFSCEVEEEDSIGDVFVNGGSKKFPSLLSKKFILKNGHRDDWNMLKSIKNGLKLEKYISKKSIHFIQSNNLNCKICNSKQHKMKVRYDRDCHSCDSGVCLKRYRAYICCETPSIKLKKQKVELCVRGKCIGKKNEIETKRKGLGISSLAKTHIDRMIKENVDLTAKECHCMLINGKIFSSEYLPELYQIQGYFKRKRKYTNNNSIEEMNKKVSDHPYDIELPDEQPFFFNIKQSGEGKTLLNNGSSTNHLRIMMTSKNLMKNCEKEGVIHIDGTYKLIRNGFPLLVIGVTDIQGTFHPIAFCITSNEDESDFSDFYSGLIELAEEMGIEFEPEFIMQDSWDASYNAARKVGFKCPILMCYFHVMFNIICQETKKKRTKIGCYLKINIKKKQNTLYEYVRVQWFESRFNNWMIYHTPAGWANTNSNIESFNAVIKRDFFKRKRLSVFGAVLKIEDIIKYYSTANITFSKYPKYVEDLHKKSAHYAQNDFLSIDRQNFKIKSLSQKSEYHKIDIQEKSCSCPLWLKNAICVHSLAFSNLNKLCWFGEKYSANRTNFFTKAKRGAKGRFAKAKSALKKQN